MSDAQLELHQSGPVARVEAPADIVAVIARAASDPSVDIDKLERLLALKEKMDAQAREQAFLAALSRLEPRLPQITQKGLISHGNVSHPYARLEDIDTAIRPLLAEEGFAISFDTKAVDNRVEIIGRLSHREGHYEYKSVTLPLDSSGAKNAVQSVGSTISYGRRMLVKMFFNLMEKGEDTDSEDPTPIPAEDAMRIHELLAETKSDVGRFLQFMGVNKVEDILMRDLLKANNALRVKAGRTKP